MEKVKKYQAKKLELKKAIQKDLNSGVGTKTISDIMDEVERMIKTNGKF